MKVSRCARWGCVSITSWNTEIWKSFRPQLPFCLLLFLPLSLSFTILLAILCLAKWLTSILNEWARTAWEVAAVEQGRGAGAAGWVVAWRGWACQTGGLPVMGNGIRRTCVLNATSRYNNNNCWRQSGRGMRQQQQQQEEEQQRQATTSWQLSHTQWEFQISGKCSKAKSTRQKQFTTVLHNVDWTLQNVGVFASTRE